MALNLECEKFPYFQKNSVVSPLQWLFKHVTIGFTDICQKYWAPSVNSVLFSGILLLISKIDWSFSSLFIFLRCFCSSKSLPHLFFSYYSQIPRFCFLLLPWILLSWILLSWMIMVFQNWMIMIPPAVGLSNSNFHSQDY